MKKFLLVLLAIGMACTSYASIPITTPGVLTPPPSAKAADLRLPVGNTGKFITLQDLATIKVGDFEKLTGKKMGVFKRMEFKLAQRDMRHSINKDGTVDSKKLARMASGYYDEDNGFHFGGFALGFFLGLIGILIAYLINDDNHHRRVKWAWIGFGVWIAILLVAIAAAG